MATVTENKPKVTIPPSTFTVELSYEEMVRLAAMSYRYEKCGFDRDNIFAAAPDDVQAAAEALSDESGGEF